MSEPQTIIVPRCPRCSVPLLKGDTVLHCERDEDCPHWLEHDEPLYQRIKLESEK